jgi:hypothetical protein
MPQSNGISTTAYADHLRGCADLAKEIAVRMDIRDDGARQAMLATLIISADRHNLFLAPTPEHSKTPVEPNGKPVPAVAVSNEQIDRAAARKADAQIADVPRHSTHEEDTGTRRTLFLQTIQQGVDLLNKEGHVPPITPKGLCALIKKEFEGKDNLGSLDLDELEALTEMLSRRLDVLKAAKKAKQDEDIPF